MHMEKSLPAIPAKRYFTIGEVSDLCGVKPYVLRYWEQEFSQLKPMKRRGNRRYYQHHEVLLIRRIRELLYDQGFTISGARNRLADLPGEREPLVAGPDALDGLVDGPGFPDDEPDTDDEAPGAPAPVHAVGDGSAAQPGPADPAVPPMSRDGTPVRWGRRATDLPADEISRRARGDGGAQLHPLDIAEVRAELLAIRTLLQV